VARFECRHSRCVDETAPLTSFSRWQSLAKARAFFESPPLVQIRKDAGVESPEFIYLNELEAGTL
jgi:heme-degrading monooxygenase HmoA